MTDVTRRQSPPIIDIDPVRSWPGNIPVYLTVPDVSKVLRLNVGTIYAAIQRREIPFVQVGREYRIPGWFIGMKDRPIAGYWYQEELPFGLH